MPGNALAIPYAVPNIKVTAHWLAETPFRPSWIRTPGRMQNTYANECWAAPPPLARQRQSPPLGAVKEASSLLRRTRRYCRRCSLLTAMFLAPRVGIEPTTCGLTVRRSTG
jgi:hypothetical protein